MLQLQNLTFGRRETAPTHGPTTARDASQMTCLSATTTALLKAAANPAARKTPELQVASMETRPVGAQTTRPAIAAPHQAYKKTAALCAEVAVREAERNARCQI